jgi:hypothetical protein
MIKYLMCVVLSVCATLACADAPNFKVDTVTYSANKKIKVVSKTTGKTIALNQANKMLWQINRYVKFSYVSNDGQYLAAMYGGGNLIPVDFDEGLILVTLFRSGKVIKEIKLGDVISSKTQLELTSSHYYWGDALGFTDSSKFEIKRRDGKVISYELKDL